MEPFEKSASRGQTPHRLEPVVPIGAQFIDPASVVGGAVITIAVGLLFSGFGAALGLTAINAEAGEGSATLALFLTAGWVLITMIVAYAVGGYVAGRMRRPFVTAKDDEVRLQDGMNGLVVWGIGVIASALVLGSVVGGTLSTATDVAATVAAAADIDLGGNAAGTGTTPPAADQAEAATADPMQPLARQLLRSETVTPLTAGREGTEADVVTILNSVADTGDISDADRSYLVAVTAARTGLDPAAAEARVDQVLNSARTTVQGQAELANASQEMARQVAETARISAILSAFLLSAAALVAAVAAYAAAVAGGRHRDEGRVFGGSAWGR